MQSAQAPAKPKFEQFAILIGNEPETPAIQETKAKNTVLVDSLIYLAILAVAVLVCLYAPSF